MSTLFKDENKTDVSENYNTLEKVEELRKEVENHPAYELFKVELDNAEKIIKAKYPTIKVEDVTYVKRKSDFNLKDGVTANDQEDGNITSKVTILDDGGFSSDKVGEYTVVYKVIDKDLNSVTKERKIIVYGKSEYLSDMNWISAQSGWRSVIKDKAVGTNDKIKLNIDGSVKTFDKGFGAATNAEIVYDLEGQYDYFTTYVGTDKNFDMDSTTIKFRILADGKEVYKSDVIRKDTPAEFVSLDIKGVKRLVLIADDVDGNLVGDFASWADTKLYQNYLKPVIKGDDVIVFNTKEKVDLLQGIVATDYEDGDITSKVKVNTDYSYGKFGVFDVVYSVTDSDNLTTKFTRKVAITEEETYISDLKWKSATIGSGAIGIDKSVRQQAIKILNEDGYYETFTKGIGTHAYSEIVYNSSGYDIFDTWVGMDQYVSGRDDASVQFKIFVDGKLKAQTGVMKANTPKERLVVDVRNSSEIKLVVDVATNGNNWDHANWADARFRNVPQFSTVQLEKALKEAKKLDLNNYTEQSIEVLENAIKFGEDALNSTNQEVIDSAVESLNSAIDSLVELNLNKVVNIKDEYLKQSIQKELNTSGEITIGQMRQLVSLKVSNAESLEGLQYAINLESLDISYNEIRDLSPLKNLKKLTDLKANPLGGLISGRVYAEDNKAKVSLDVINRNGEKLLPTSVVVKHNKTHEYTTLDINDCMDKNGVVTIDTTGFDSYIYTIYLVYEDKVDNYTSQFMFMLDNI